MTATVLLVDDEPASGIVLATLLRKEGFEVRLADTIEESLERVEEERPDVILCDAQLGYESAYDLIRRLPMADQIPVLVMSEDAKAIGICRGAIGILPKQFPTHEFSRAIRSAINVCDRAAA